MALFHVWFSTKGRQDVLVGELRDLVLSEVERLAKVAKVTLIAAQTEYDHLHLLLRVDDVRNLSSVMHLLKGSSSRTITLQYPELRAEMGKAFWQKSFGRRLVTEDQLETVRRYIETQDERPARHNT
jgi:putative transposase